MNSARLCVFLLGLVSVPVFGGSVLVLKGPSEPPYDEALTGFRQVYSSGIEISKKKDFLARIRTDPSALIVAIGRVSAEMAHENAPANPLVFVMVPNPTLSGLTGSNIAGISMDVPAGVQLSHFKDLLPNTKKRVAILYNPANKGSFVAEAQKAAHGLGLVLEPIEVESAAQVGERIELVKPVIGAIWVVPDETLADRFPFLVDETTTLHLPLFVSMNAASIFVERGALAAVVPDFLDMGRECGELVNQIETGKTTIGGESSIRPPVDVNWQINLKTADKIGLTIPPSLLKSAKVFH